MTNETTEVKKDEDGDLMPGHNNEPLGVPNVADGEEVIFTPVTPNTDEEILKTAVQEAEEDIKKSLDNLADVEGVERKYSKDTDANPDVALLRKIKTLAFENMQDKNDKVHSDGSTASYYELPEGAKELQDLISHRNMNAQLGEIFRECYRYGQASHCDELRGAKKIKFYIDAEIERLTKLNEKK